MSFKNAQLAFSRQPKWFRITSYLATAYLCYAIILGAVIPAVLKAKLPNMAADVLGRQVELNDVSINPFLLNAELSQFTIFEQNGKTPFFTVESFALDVAFLRSLITLTPTLESIDINAPYVHLARLDNRADKANTQLNISDILTTLAASNAQSNEVTDEESVGDIPHLRIAKFQLQQGHALFTDQITGAKLDYPQLELVLNDIDTRATIASEPQTQQDNRYAFDITTAEQGHVSMRGDFQLAPLVATTQISLSNIALAPLWPLSDNAISAKLDQGTLNLDFIAKFEALTDTFAFHLNEGELSLNDIVFSYQDEALVNLPVLKLENMRINSLIQQVDIEHIGIEGLTVKGVYDDKGLNLQRLFSPHLATTNDDNAQQNSPSAATSDSSDDTASDWRVELSTFSFIQGSLQLQERQFNDNTFWHLSQLSLETGPVSSTLANPIDYSFYTAVSASNSAEGASSERTKGTFSSVGSVDATTQSVKGCAEIHQFELDQFQQYAERYARITIEDGAFSSTLAFKASADGQIDLHANADIRSLNVLDNTQSPLLKWQSLSLSDIHYSAKENGLTINDVIFDSPYARMVIDENKATNISALLVPQTTNISALLVPQTTHSANESAITKAQAPTTQNKDAMAIMVNHVGIKEGSAYFADHSLTPRFASKIDRLNGYVDNLDSRSDSAANVNIEGKIDGYAPVQLKGQINPLKEDIFLDLLFSVDGAELTSVNPYSGTYMGHYIDKGLLSLDVEYTLNHNQLQGNNHVVIDQLTLGQKSDSDQALSLPLGLAIALLEDSQGVIDLGLEVSGDLDSPTFGFGSIILNALGNLITKAVTAPFSLLANLVGSDDELDHIAFAPGSSYISKQGEDTLDTLTKALKSRPRLRVNIEGTVDAVSDATALAESMVKQAILARTNLSTLPADLTASSVPLSGEITDALTALYSETFNSDIQQERQHILSTLQQEKAQEEGNEAALPYIPSEESVQRVLNITMYNTLRNKVTITEAELANLAESRAKAVKGYLVNTGGLETTRVFLLNSQHHLQSEYSGVELTLEAN